MSYLKWEIQTRAIPGTNNTVFANHWELWNKREREWYDNPLAVIRKVKRGRYDLILTDDEGEQGEFDFPTLKAAKAMGIVLTRME